MDEKQKEKPELEGEGSYTGAKRYDDEAEQFAREEDVDALAKEAAEVSEEEKGVLRAAEQAGKERIAEEDPELRK
jgi:hypothetical protein